jgi:hypothetical protein
MNPEEITSEIREQYRLSGLRVPVDIPGALRCRDASGNLQCPKCGCRHMLKAANGKRCRNCGRLVPTILLHSQPAPPPENPDNEQS